MSRLYVAYSVEKRERKSYVSRGVFFYLVGNSQHNDDSHDNNYYCNNDYKRTNKGISTKK